MPELECDGCCAPNECICSAISLNERIDDIDDILMRLEDHLHGASGDLITDARKQLSFIKKRFCIKNVCPVCKWHF